MEREFVILAQDRHRQRAVQLVMSAPQYARVEFKPPKRTLDQNAKMHAMLGDIAKQHLWHGLHLPKDDWKLVFLDALHREMRLVPNLDGTGFVSLNKSSSDLSVGEMSDMVELMYAWGADPAHPVIWSEPEIHGHPFAPSDGEFAGAGAA